MTVRELRRLLAALPEDVQDDMVLMSVGTTVADAVPMAWGQDGESLPVVSLQHLDVLEQLQAVTA